MDGKNFRPISGLAELSREVRNMADIRLSANVFGWYLDQGNYRRTKHQ